MPPSDPPRRILVLCFDGTGNTFRADGNDTNILKIFSMLDRNDDEFKYYYYQPGIGTEISATSLASAAFRRRRRLWTNTTLDLALGHSFDQHLIGGYRFLMRHYRSNADIYLFGYSRGAYTARFLNEMLDYVGLLSADNEELIPLIWEAFATWKLTRPDKKTEAERDASKAAFGFLKLARESLCRPVCQVKFLGLFDTVNSIAEFQVDTRLLPSSRVIRHAVSIDERRVKFQPVLLIPSPVISHHHLPVSETVASRTPHASAHHRSRQQSTGTPPVDFMVPLVTVTTVSTEDQNSIQSIESDPSLRSLRAAPNDDEFQDMQEVWFPGAHGDIGGGWKCAEGETYPLSHGPLVWMLREAQKAGLPVDPKKMQRLNCLEDDDREREEESGGHQSHGGQSSSFADALKASTIEGLIHDRLRFGPGRSTRSVLVWRMVEYLLPARMDLQSDGTWKLIRRRLHRGRPRDVPNKAEIHVSAIRRMAADPSYRPGNLIIGGGGRGVRKAPEEYGIGEWQVWANAGDVVGETYVRKMIS